LMAFHVKGKIERASALEVHAYFIERFDVTISLQKKRSDTFV